MLGKILITNTKELDKIKSKIAEEGTSKLHILADFDKTLTKAFVNGEKIPSVISVLRDGNYLTKDYSEKAHKLYEKYHPIEINPEISLEEKKKAMHEWWHTHFELLIRSKLTKKDIEKVVNSGKIELREGCLEFLDFLHKRNIPLVIMSSAGLGYESISMYLEKNNHLYNNTHIISNEFIWDKNDYAVGDSIIFDLTKNDFKEHIALKKGSIIYLTGGNHTGEVGVVEDLARNKVVFKIGNNKYETKKDFVFVIGKDKPAIMIK